MQVQRQPFIYAAILSLSINACIIHVAHQTFPTQKHFIPEKNQPVIFQFPEKYIDTSDLKTEKNITDNKYISDTNSLLDSSRKGDIEGILPQSNKQHLDTQAKREYYSKDSDAQQQIQQATKLLKDIEKKETLERDKQALENKISVVKDKTKQLKKEDEIKKTSQNSGNAEDALKEIEQTNISMTKPVSLKKDLFPLPSISIGNHNFSKDGIDSFAANASLLGKYMKRMRDKIGLKFYQMIFFHYKTTYIFASRTKIVFNIDKRGNITKFNSKMIEGDILFKEYCETVIKNTTPFAPLPEGLKPYLEEDGTLQIDFLFGYNIPEN